jgi:hypothetical protein
MSDQRERDMLGIVELDRGMPSPEVTIQADVFGLNIAFVAHVSEKMLDPYLDMVRRRIDKMRAYQLMYEAMTELAGKRRTLAMADELLANELRKIAEAKIKQRADYENAGRSGVLTGRQMGELAKFDQQIEGKRTEFAAKVAQLEKELPALEGQIARHRALIDHGIERAATIGFGELPEAAE